jgi:acyl carrier protein
MTTDTARSAVISQLSRIAPEADLSSVDPASDLRREIDLDSLDFLALIEALATSTGVSVPESDYDQVRSLDALVAYLAAHGAR